MNTGNFCSATAFVTSMRCACSNTYDIPFPNTDSSLRVCLLISNVKCVVLPRIQQLGATPSLPPLTCHRWVWRYSPYWTSPHV